MDKKLENFKFITEYMLRNLDDINNKLPYCI